MINWNAASTKRGIIWVATALVGSVFIFMGKPVDQLLLLAGGGSGGNTSAATGADGAGTAGQGFAGGTGGGALKASGGGGAGVSNSITGAAVLYGGW